MRTGPFAEPSVIELLNRHFVPAFVVNEDHRDAGSAPADERAEMHRIYLRTLSKKMSAGSVHVYVVEPGGEPIASLHVAEAARAGRLKELLEKIVAERRIPPGEPLAAPRPLSVAPSCGPEERVVHFVARPVKGGGSWPGVSENWIALGPAQSAKLGPPAGTLSGGTWALDADALRPILVHMYPVTENNDPAKNRIVEFAATAKRLAEGKVRIDGRLRMRHDFYHRDDGKEVDAEFVALAEFVADGSVRRFRLATTRAEYGGGTFAVAAETP